MLEEPELKELLRTPTMNYGNSLFEEEIDKFQLESLFPLSSLYSSQSFSLHPTTQRDDVSSSLRHA